MSRIKHKYRSMFGGLIEGESSVSEYIEDEFSDAYNDEIIKTMNQLLKSYASLIEILTDKGTLDINDLKTLSYVSYGHRTITELVKENQE